MLPTRYLLLAGLLAATPATADVITLKDGRVVEGVISRKGEQLIITPPEGAPVVVNAGDVTHVKLTASVTPAEAASAEWVRLQANMKKSEDLPQIIAWHEAFLKQHPNTPTTAAVKDSLKQHQDMAAQGYVRFRGQWLPPAKAEIAAREGQQHAQKALEHYKAGKLPDAQTAAQAALKSDPHQPLALTLTGLIAYRQNQQGVARQQWARLTELHPDNILGWNNLAILSFAQKREPEALVHYTKALTQQPGHRLLVDNITAALAAYAASKESPAYRDLLRLYEQAETRLRADLAAQGLQRYGSTWVNKEDFQRITDNIAAVKEKMAALDLQYQKALIQYTAAEDGLKRARVDYDALVADYNYFNALVIAAQQRGVVDMFLIGRRDALLLDIDRNTKLRVKLEQQLLQLAATIKPMRTQAGELTAALAKLETAPVFAQRIMEPGDVENVPPPAAVELPAKVPPPTTAPATPAQGPVAPANTAQRPADSGPLGPVQIQTNGVGFGGDNPPSLQLPHATTPLGRYFIVTPNPPRPTEPRP